MLCGNEARAEDEVEGRKTVVATSTGATTNENEEKYKFDSTRIPLRLTTDDFCYDSYCFPLYSVGGGGGSSSSRALLAPRLSPPPRALFSRPPHIFTFPRPSPFPLPSHSLAMQHQPNFTATIYSLWYLWLLDLLRNERATAPRLRTEDPVEWLAWVHTIRWLIVSPLYHPSCLL